ncbi:MAG: hypothetical protein IBV52_08185 [Candidatus Bathyarchaeota archaeon]
MRAPYYPLEFKPIGSSKSDDYLQYAEVYKNMIEFSFKKFSEEPPIHDYSLAPILLLLRQYIELQLKGIIIYGEYSAEVIGTHDIVFLYKKALKAIEEKYGVNMLGKPNKDAEKFIYALGKFDEKGELGRYPETREGVAFFDKIKEMGPWLHDRIASFSALSQIAEKVIGDLEGMEGYLDIMSDNEEESLANY